MVKIVKVLWKQALTLTYDEHFKLAVSVGPGEGTLVIVEMKSEPDSEFHDIDLVNELCLQFSDQPTAGETLDAGKALRRALFQAGSTLLLYQSAQFTGTVNVKRWEPGNLVSGSCDLVFSHPLVDQAGVGEVHVQMDF